ncbi:transposase [Streptomyces sp. NBC_01102]|uniref:transposase n=1 Tax=Streptomyces sp. NBC_01102 TaxID=2903749 RepID=UPI003870A6C2
MELWTSVAALCCYKAGEKSRLIHRPRTHLLLKGARKSFSWQDCRDLLVRAHIQLDGPIVVAWDNLNTHLAAGLKQYEAEHDWLTTVRLPPYAPDLPRRGCLLTRAQSSGQHRFHHRGTEWFT